MKSFITRFLSIALLTMLGFSPVLAQTVFKAQLSGRSEVMPVATAAGGEITATLTGTQLIVTGSFENLSAPFDPAIAGGSHIHAGYAGENGEIAITLIPMLDIDLLGGTFLAATNTFNLSPEQVDLLMSRQMYVNIHTTAFGSGELRGQLLAESEAYFGINLFGSHEVPSIMSSASGGLALELNGDQLVVTGSFENLQGDFAADIAGGAHLHLGLPGQNGGISIELNTTVDADLKGGIFSATDNTFILSMEQMEALQSGGLYANIHSEDFPSGELRGQVGPIGGVLFRAHLSGNNENPAITSRASGVVHAALVDGTLSVYGSFSGLESDMATAIAGGAHIHLGVAGTNGDVAIPINATINADQRSGIFAIADNQFELTADQTAALLARGMYVNIHSVDNQPGEIRGQLLLESQIYFSGNLSGIFTNPTFNTRASGAVKAELSGTRLTLTGSFNNLGSPLNLDILGGAHIHLGAAGANGDVIFPLVSQIDIDASSGVFGAVDNTFTLSSEQVAQIRAREFYVNIHSLEVPSGELRAQLLGEANFYFTAPLSGASEAPVIRTEASGNVIVEVNGNRGIAVGGFSGLQSPFDESVAGGAHIHAGMAGQNGGIILFLNAETDEGDLSGVFEANDNVISLTDGQIDTLRQRMFYVNIHTEANQSGELRGQFLPVATAYFTNTLSGMNEVQPIMTDASGAFKLELHGNVLVATGSFANLAGEFDANIAGGSHLHLGLAGTNGGISINLNASLAADLKSGVYTAAENRFELDEIQTEALYEHNFYTNIHSTVFPSGELRGQVLTEINFFPTAAPEVTLPLDGAAILLEGAVNTAFAAEWTEASDDSPLAYIWQLSASESFDQILFQQNVAGQLLFLTDFGTVDMLLANAGVEVGSSITLYHRVIASDGSLRTAGEASTVVITRGVITSTNEIDTEQLNWSAYPNITSDQVQLDIAYDRPADAELVLSDAFGRPVLSRNLQISQATLTTNMEVNQFPAGAYVLSLLINGELAGSKRIIVR